MNKKIDKNQNKLILLIVFVLIIIILFLGATYALIQTVAENRNIRGNTSCYTINYVKGQDISGELELSNTYVTGKSTDVVMYSEPNCANLLGTIYITSNPESVMNYSDNALRYTVVANGVVVSEGAINGTVNQPIYDNFVLSKTSITYKVYVWLDEELEDFNDLTEEMYSGFIHVDVRGASGIVD